MSQEEATNMKQEDLKAILTDLYERRGVLNPEDLLDEASDPTHPLHERFSWDNAEAAQRWRITQAANIIRSVKVEITLPDSEVVQVRAFLPTHGRESDQEGGRAYDYAPVESLSEIAMHRIEEEMERDLERLRTKYAAHSALFHELLHKTAAKPPKKRRVKTG
jgi:hypothetical protein